MTTALPDFLRIHPTDNVVVALQDLPQGYTIPLTGQPLILPRSVSAKHKVATEALGINDPVRMYGVVVGKATQPIGFGEVITTFNLKHDAQTYGLDQRAAYTWQPPDVSAWQSLTFAGYHRADGSVGTRNYWLVVPLVFCENRNIEMMKAAFERELGYAQPDTYLDQVRNLVQQHQHGGSGATTESATAPPDRTRPDRTRPDRTAPADRRSGQVRPEHLFSNVDGIKFLTHELGCGGTNADAEGLCQMLAGCIANPNVAGVTVLSLGCQKSQIDQLQTEILKRQPGFDKPLLYFDQQTYGTEAAMLTDAIRDTFDGLVAINSQTRRPAPLSKLTVGLKCGGSDGFSGISANPALGHLSDLLVTLGGTTLLAEFPELCGVEQELIDRCAREADAARFVQLMGEYAAQAAAVGAGFDMNPSVGNIKDGLITDAIKSAGAARKGGYSPIAGVLDYADLATRPGLHLLCTPGNDVLATTGMAASGATLILFTTGLGTPTGNPITPTVKISTNTRLASRMTDIIDFDSGSIVSGNETIAQNGERLLRYLIEVASGTVHTKAEDLGQNDFIPWQRGVNL